DFGLWTLDFFSISPLPQGTKFAMVNQMVKYKYHSATLDATFAALADPTRRQLLRQLAKGDQRVTQLAKPFSMSLPAVSKHLRVLEEAGLLTRRRQGREHHLE